MNDVSVVDSKVQIKDISNSIVQSNDTNNDTENDTSKVTWSNHAQQRTYSDGDGAQQPTYSDGDGVTLAQQSTYGNEDDIIDISEAVTSVNKPYIYKSYRDACNGSKGSKKACRESTITYGRNPHHVSNRRRRLPSSKQVTSE